MVSIKLRQAASKFIGITGVLALAACGGSGTSPSDFVDSLPDEIIPIVIENEDEIRDIIEEEIDENLQDDANEIIDLIVAVTTTSVSVTAITATAGTN